MATISSNEVNYLVLRYLRESNFSHSAFAFGAEADAQRFDCEAWANRIGKGALINLIQKGLQYAAIEATVDENGEEVELKEPFAFFGRTIEVELDAPDEEAAAVNGEEPARKRRRESIDDQVMQEAAPSANGIVETKSLTEEDIQLVQGAERSTSCAWNPSIERTLATGSRDGQAMIWNFKLDHPLNITRLPHAPSVSDVKDITYVAWNPDGTLIATGGFDGQCRIWTLKGELRHNLFFHRGSLLAIRWKPDGSQLLTFSVDGHCVVWDADSGQEKYIFSNSSAHGLDAEWIDESSLVTCGTEGTIQLWRFGEKEPVRNLRGHSSDVSTVRWNPAARLLASAGDDGARIWDVSQEECRYNLLGHTGCVVSLRWHPKDADLLATCALDSTLRLWNASNGNCILTLTAQQAVFILAFAPDGNMIAGGMKDGSLNVWRIEDGGEVAEFKGGESFGPASDLQFGPASASDLAVVWTERGLGTISLS